MATSMTRQHFEAIAEAMAQVGALPNADLVTCVMMARHVGIALKQFNPVFDLDRFMEAALKPNPRGYVHPNTVADAKEYTR